jgi:hypothetical protein
MVKKINEYTVTIVGLIIGSIIMALLLSSLAVSCNCCSTSLTDKYLETVFNLFGTSCKKQNIEGFVGNENNVQVFPLNKSIPKNI